MPLEHIDTAAIVGAATKPNVEPADAEQRQHASERGRWAFDYAIKAMLFADAVGYSRLSEQQIPLFFEHYVGAIAAYNEATDHKPVHMETAGDGMYMVFDDTGMAGRYALGLSEIINACDWKSRGLPADLSVRIGLHCGPVFIATDPITRQPLYSGIHTSRTARIEPITPPGQVYTSSAFAAVATALGASGLRFSYIGHTQLAKHYGVLPLYHMKRKYRDRQAAGR
jgi:class 3 adenylate cyclase